MAGLVQGYRDSKLSFDGGDRDAIVLCDDQWERLAALTTPTRSATNWLQNRCSEWVTAWPSHSTDQAWGL